MLRAQLAYNADSECVQNTLTSLIPPLSQNVETGKAIAGFRAELLKETSGRQRDAARGQTVTRNLYNILEPLQPNAEWRYGIALTLLAISHSDDPMWQQTMRARLDRFFPITTPSGDLNATVSALSPPQTWAEQYANLINNALTPAQIMKLPLPATLGRDR